MKATAMTFKSIHGILNARAIMPDNSAIDMMVQTDSGDIPFLYVKDDDAPLAVLVAEYLSAKPDFKIAPYQAPKPPPEAKKVQKPKGGNND